MRPFIHRWPALSLPRTALAVVAPVVLVAAGCASTPPKCTDEEIATWGTETITRLSPHIAYPTAARQDSLTGLVRLRLLIDETDTVQELTVLESSGHAVLDEAALASARKVAFVAPVCGGRKVPQVANIPINFKLDDQ